jgi:hypothetical protein
MLSGTMQREASAHTTHTVGRAVLPPNVSDSVGNEKLHSFFQCNNNNAERDDAKRSIRTHHTHSQNELFFPRKDGNEKLHSFFKDVGEGGHPP